MSSQSEPSNTPRPMRDQRRRRGWTIRITPAGVLLLVVINLLILGGWVYGITRFMNGSVMPGQESTDIPSETPMEVSVTYTPVEVTATSQPTASPTAQSTDTATPDPATASPQPLATLTLNQGLIILALDEGGDTHLFAYQPEEVGAGLPLPLTRLTYGPWDDITPAISPDGQSIAFASNRSGYWDIYLLNLNTGDITRLTDTREYEASPAWSPDNKWLVYEAYMKENLDVWIQSIASPKETIQLTNNPAADFSPTWSPDGRRIAFVSNRGGENDIWLADLDKSEETLFQNISQNPNGEDTHPAWAPDGLSLVWVGELDGLHQLFLTGLPPTDEVNTTPTAVQLHNLGSGDWPVWSTDGDIILTSLQAPNRVYLTAYRAQYPGLVLPTLELPGALRGLSWGKIESTTPLQVIYQMATALTPTPIYYPVLTAQPSDNGGRYQLSPLASVEAPQPYLHDMTDESFSALRAQIGKEAGWDFLSTLENAYVPLTTPLDPGMGNDWLYTSRAYALNTLPIDAGWLVVIRDDFGSETYWRIYIRSLYQDGSAGIPLHDQAWDFYSRNNGDTTTYEQGGAKQISIPVGYWIDFTALARSYGWERLPALNTWRASYPATRFNEFVITGGLDWQTAMLEIYPPETMITPSPVYLPTRTATPTSRWYVSPTPTATSTPRPTLTPFLVSPTISPASPVPMQTASPTP
jgi:TolB protein